MQVGTNQEKAIGVINQITKTSVVDGKLNGYKDLVLPVKMLNLDIIDILVI